MKETSVTNFTAFIRPETENEACTLEGCEVHAFTHFPGEIEPDHTHAQNHTIFIRSGRMRWGVNGEFLDAVAGDVIVAPAGVPHSYEVLGDEPARVMCIIAPAPPPGEATKKEVVHAEPIQESSRE